MMMELKTVDGRPVATWDPVQHPYWPPVDSDEERVVLNWAA